jgi:hypothetical protein
MATDDFDTLLNAALDAARKALDEGKYKKELRALLSLSMADIKLSVPRASFADYSTLISVVEQASAKNVSQEILVSNIVALGSSVVAVAKLVPGLDGLLP